MSTPGNPRSNATTATPVKLRLVRSSSNNNTVAASPSSTSTSMTLSSPTPTPTPTPTPARAMPRIPESASSPNLMQSDSAAMVTSPSASHRLVQVISSEGTSSPGTLPRSASTSHRQFTTLQQSSSSSSHPHSNSSSTGPSTLPRELKAPFLPHADTSSVQYKPYSLSSAHWYRAPIFGRLPTRPMRAHTSTLVHMPASQYSMGENALYVFGGCDSKNCFRDVWKLDMDTFQWSKPKLRSATSNTPESVHSPPPLRAHTATWIPPFYSKEKEYDVYSTEEREAEVSSKSADGHILIFGGGDGPNYYNDIYLLNLTTQTWHKPLPSSSSSSSSSDIIQITGTIPSPRRAHTSVWYDARKELIVFGGGNGSKALNDTYILECEKWNQGILNWKKLETSGKKPKLRGYHTMNLVGDELLVHGGSDGTDCFSDIFTLDLLTSTWAQIPIYSPSISCPRLSHSSTLISPTLLLILGGHDGTEYKSTLTLFNLSTNTFKEINDVSGIGPSKRGYHSAVYYKGRIVLLGGYDGRNHFDEAWCLEVGVMAELESLGL